MSGEKVPVDIAIEQWKRDKAKKDAEIEATQKIKDAQYKSDLEKAKAEAESQRQFERDLDAEATHNKYK